MAGGSGTRLWPLSRQAHPKQTLTLVGDRSMYQQAVDRLLPIMPADHIITITTTDLADVLAQQVPELPAENILIEPEGRGTAPVIGLGALYARQLAGGPAVVACLTADHYISNVAEFQRVLKAAAQVAEGGQIVTLGIKPSFGSTGFGYIQRGDALESADGLEVFQAIKFKEKPSEEMAASFVADGQHSWNSGMFVWTTTRVVDEFARQLPETAAKLDEVAQTFGSPQITGTLARVWPTVPKETIDYGIMEGASDVAVIPVDIGWNDIGNWASLLDVLEPDENGNVVLSTRHYQVDTTGSLIKSNRLVATIGLTNVVIVDTEDSLLVCSRDRAQDVKRIVEQLQMQKESRYL